jgi:hypothetical protein
MGIDDKNKQMLFDDKIDNYKLINLKELKKTPYIKGGGFEMRNPKKEIELNLVLLKMII